MLPFAGLEQGLAAVALTAFMLWLLNPLARRWQWVDVPNGRKDHAHPTPITGGLAMAIGILGTAWLTIDVIGPALMAFTAGAALLIVVGLLDDRYDLRWYLRILAQVVAALLIATWGGVRIEHLGPVFGLADEALGPWSIPFTVFATVGLINAINMVDGVDGLAGALVLTALLMLGAACVYSGNGAMAERVLILAGAVGAFLAFNLRFPWQRRAKVFMGNAGSAFLGFAIAWVVFRLTQDPRHPVSPVLALWLLPVPVIDTLVVMLRRMRNRQSPFLADHNHVHHIMRSSGYSPMQKVLVLCGFSAACGLAAGQALRMDVPEPLLLLAFVALAVFWYWLTARRERAVAFFTRLRTLPRLSRGAPPAATHPVVVSVPATSVPASVAADEAA